MPVSSGLQKYFDSQRKKKGDMQDKLQKLAGQIDPAFLKSFEEFHDKIMWIVDENPEATEIVSDELEELDVKLQNSNRKHNLKKAASIIQSSENLS